MSHLITGLVHMHTVTFNTFEYIPMPVCTRSKFYDMAPNSFTIGRASRSAFELAIRVTPNAIVNQKYQRPPLPSYLLQYQKSTHERVIVNLIKLHSDWQPRLR